MKDKQNTKETGRSTVDDTTMMDTCLYTFIQTHPIYHTKVTADSGKSVVNVGSSATGLLTLV